MIKAVIEYLRFGHRKSFLSKTTGCECEIHASAKIVTTGITLSESSTLIVEEGAKIDNSIINIRGNSTVIIGKNSVIENTKISSSENGKIVFSEGCIINIKNTKRANIYAVNGNMHFGYRVKSYADLILCRFGATFSAGQYTGIGEGSEIIAEDRVEIGEFVLISYDVCIYDSNSHAVDAAERRKGIIEGYPGGLWDKIKPGTKPVKIGNDVWIGKGATITKGAIIPDETIIGLRTNYGGIQLDAKSVLVSPPARIL